MISRYTLPEMAAVWSDERRLAVWKEVEALVVAGWVELGAASPEAAAAVAAAPIPTPEQVAEREKVTNHDVAAFVDVLADSVETGGEWVHHGLTSSDVLDTANGVLMRDAADLLIRAIGDLFRVVKARALEHRETVMLGRTHGIWAEPTSFGVKLATWAFELARDHGRLGAAREAAAVGKISGAVGTYAHVPPALEEFVCGRLGIGIEPASSQITHRDRHAQLLSAIALTGSSLERFATEIRHLQRSEIREVSEPFGAGQKGSSAMPHKRNPILSERITGLARLLRGYAQTGMENIALWHERDISHSSAERVILPDACTTLHYMLVKLADMVANLVVAEDRMRANLESTGGMVYSQAVLLALVESGRSRDEAYRIVQRNAMRAWEEGRHLRDLLEADPEVGVPATTLDRCFEPGRYLRNAAVIFERLTGLELG